ncbi:MAG: Alanine dehydrogenase [uncultured Thermomicrobiales bacterium]|uniref:Alanine dehydrogenase n=1 Tax=uncultured Thermomicrobiales bacterium TaxID=1645740 RepID=A0A6J4UK65_9BACT|nr:MAG: Alanine dehydrogenase [uncultured Thermomicrobiales bacterium]
MIVGVPREIKDREHRVSTTPAGVGEYVAHGHRVLVERGAGVGSGFADAEYAAAGADLVDSHADAFLQADMVAKVKEPLAEEFSLLRPGQILFTFLHLAAAEPLTRALVANRVTAVAYETVQVPVSAAGASGLLPLLTPMSEVAGRMAIQVGAHYLERTQGGRGTLLGGVPGVPPAEVVVIGGGVVGSNAAQMALGLGASVSIFDRNVERLRYLDHVLGGRLITRASNRQNVGEAVAAADLVIGGVLIAGAKAPKLVTREMVGAMRPGSVVIDVAIDQGGCIETARPTSHSDPVFLVDGVIHYCVTNMPGAVPRTSTLALANVTLPYGLELADYGLDGAVARDPALAQGINTLGGAVTHQGVAEAFGLPYTPVVEALHAARSAPASLG